MKRNKNFRSTETRRSVGSQFKTAKRSALVDDYQEPDQHEEAKYFKAISLNTAENMGYQMERRQEPLPRFPVTLASYVMVFEMDEPWVKWVEHAKQKDTNVKELSVSYALLTVQPLMDKMRSADMIVRVFTYEEDKKCFALISVSEKRQKMVAQYMESIRLRIKKKDDEGNYIVNGGAWADFKQHLSTLYEHSSEGTLFSSCQQCQVIEFLLNDVDERALGPQLMQKDACEHGNTTLMQLQKDEKISDYFYMHHERKRKWLEEHWSSAYFSKQPIEAVREYFGETIALYFVWMGYILTMSWVPAMTGLFVFIMGGVAYSQASTFDSPYVPLFAIFMSVWAIILVGGWKRLEMTMQHEWDTSEYKPPKTDRPEFIQNKRTYKRLNQLSQKEEYYADPLWRGFAIAFAAIVVPLCLFFMVQFSIALDVTEATITGGVKGGPVSYVFAALHGFVLVMLCYAFDRYSARLLADFENWQTDEEYNASRISKYIFFTNVAITFCIYFWAVIGNEWEAPGVQLACPNKICYDSVIFKIPVMLVSIRLTRWFVLPAVRKFLEEEAEGFVSKFVADVGGKVKELVKNIQASVTGFFNKKDENKDGGEGSAEALAISNESRNIYEEYKKPKFKPWDLNEWYLDKLMDLLWVMLFSGIMPLLPLMLLGIQIFDLRKNAGHLTNHVQRVRYSCSRDIGVINDMLDIFVVVAIITQTCMLAFASNGLLYYFPGITAPRRAFLALVIEHLLLLFMAIYLGHVEVPEEAELAHERKKEEKKHLLRDMDHFNPTKDVVFYTSDDGEAFYGKSPN